MEVLGTRRSITVEHPILRSPIRRSIPATITTPNNKSLLLGRRQFSNPQAPTAAAPAEPVGETAEDSIIILRARTRRSMRLQVVQGRQGTRGARQAILLKAAVLDNIPEATPSIHRIIPLNTRRGLSTLRSNSTRHTRPVIPAPNEEDHP